MPLFHRRKFLVLASLVLLVAPLARAEELREETLRRIAFGSCASQDKNQPIWKAVVAARPDLFLMIGDNIYADTEDMSVMSAKYAQLAAKPGFQKLRASCPILATWDDHDFGVNDGGSSYPKKVESQKIMLDFFDVPADSPRRTREGVYGAYRFGPEGKRVQIILLDARYFKSEMTADTRSDEEKRRLGLVGWYVPNNDPQATILGEAQWKWLERQLLKPADVRIIASSMQIVADEKGMESWGNAPHERQRLYELIKSTEAKGALFISGDVHFSEISRTDDGPYPLYDFTSSGLTNSHAGWAAAINTHRISEIAYAKPTFGLVKIDWETPSPTITFQARGVEGNVAFQKSISLSELQ